MPSLDAFDLPLTCSEDAAACWRLGAERLLAGTGSPRQAADAALAHQPDFALGHALRARALLFDADIRAAQEAAQQGIQLATQASEREQSHAALVGDLVNGRPETLARSREHLARWPQDVLVLSPAAGVFGLIGFSGRADRETEQLELLEPFAAVYGDHWWFQMVLGFALLETGEPERATELVSRALAQRPDSGHVAHTLVHAHFEAGRHDQAQQWLADWLPAYSSDDMLYCHLWWHLALFHLLNRDFNSVWAICDGHCAPGRSSSPPINLFTDRVALTWRAQLQGAEVSVKRWQDLRDYGEGAFPRPGVFVDVHYAAVLAALEDWNALADYEDACRAALDKGRLRAGGVVVDLIQGLRAFGQRRWREAVDHLERALPQTVCIGGSRAQRRLVDETLAVARLRLA